jgi:uracil-DNA glycosylase
METITETSSSKNINIHDSWKKILAEEFDKPYMAELRTFLKQEIKNKKSIFPKPTDFFAAFNATPLEDVKVVILGQDPYHGIGQAHGLSFSVQPGVPAPPSLLNIYKELKNDLGIERATHGYLKKWADQGVLLLNSVLSVEAEKPASHKNRGWEKFTDKVIQVLNDHKAPKVFFLWGNYAQQKGAIIDRKKHLVIESVHPSPLSAMRGFFGTKPFSKANRFLEQNKISAIDWKLPTDAE